MSTYSFTALLEADLLQGINGTSIGVGDTFVMPEGATVEIVVTDDDSTLSGDYYYNEQGDDQSGQTADITVNGEQVFNDVKIYAEQYHVLQDQYGNTYYMMEIETAGSEDAPGEGDDFFTFWGWTPPAGAQLTVLCTYNVTCDWMDYTCLTGGDLIVIEPENTAPVALDDAVVTDENTTITANLLANESDADGDSISVTGIEGGTVGEAFTVTTDKGYTGQVTVQADGTFTFDPDDAFKALAQDEQDSFQLTYTITDDPAAAVKHNLMFVLDISNSTVGTTGDNIFDGVGVGDVNGDGLANSVLDAEIAAVLAAVQSLIDQGVDPANIDVGIATFSGVAAGFASVDAETLGTFALDDGGLSAALQSIQSGGWTNYEAGLQEAENWFASQAGDGAQNKLVFLSDGRPISGYDYSTGQYITQTEADYGDEVNRIANDYGADIYAIGVGANSDLDYLNDLDNTGGAERVTDAATLNVVVENAVAQPASSTATVTVTINGLNEGPDAKNDALTVDEDATGSVNILANDVDPEGDTLTITDIAGNAVGSTFNVTTADGRVGTVTVDASGNLTFDPGAGFEDLNDTDTDSFSISYTISDGQFSDTATVTVLVNGKGQPVDAKDDAYSINEDQGIVDNVLGNDIPNDGSLKVVGVAEGASAASAFAVAAVSNMPVVGSEFTVTTDSGRTGTVTLAEDGTFTFDGGDNFIELAAGETDSFDLTYTVEGQASAGELPKHNILFVIDVSGSTSPAAFGGSAVGDQNGDGIENSVLDAEIAAYKALSQQIADSGLTSDKVDIGLIVFSGNNGSDQTGASELLGTFKPGSADLDTALAGLTDGGFTNFEAPLQTGIGWFEDQAATTDDKNIVYFLSDGMQNVGGAFDDEANELATRFGAELNAVGVGNGAVLDQLEQIDNTGGAEIVTTTDALTAALIDNAPIVPGDQDTATVTVTINGLNEGPVAENDQVSTTEDMAATINILANDSDPESDDLQILQVNGAAPGDVINVETASGRTGTVTYEADGTLTFTPDQSFQNLNEGESDLVELSYSVSDGQFTDDAIVSVLVNGTGDANGKVSIQGSIAASFSGQSHFVVVLDSSAFTTGFSAGATNTDLDNDGNTGAIMDLMLSKVLDLASTLGADDTITLIPSGFNGAADSVQAFTYSVADVLGAANGTSGQTPQDLFSPLVSTYSGTDYAIDLPQALSKAEAVLTDEGADLNQVIVMTSTDTVDQSGSVMARQSLADNVNAEVDVLYIEAGAFANVNNLNAIDMDGVDTDPDFNFGLTSLINPAPDLLANVEAFTVLVDGQKVLGIDESDLTVNAAGDGFDFAGEIDLNGQSGEVDIIVAIDTDMDPTTVAEVFSLSDTVSNADRTVMDQDTFVFDFA